MIARASARRLLLAHDHVAGEGVALDDPFALAVDRFEPAPHPAVLALRGALDLQFELVAQISAVRSVGELEAALRGIGQQLDVARDGLRAQVAPLRADPAPLQAARRRLERE